MSYENFCQQLYRRALVKLYGHEVEEFQQDMSESLMESLYGIDAEGLFGRIEVALAAVHELHWIPGSGWTLQDAQVPLDATSKTFFLKLIEPHADLFQRMREVPLRDKLEASLLYRVDTYQRLLEWENRYNGTAFPHLKLPQDAVRNIVQAVTVLTARQELDLLYFSPYGEFRRVLNGNSDQNVEGMRRLASMAQGFEQVIDFYFELLAALESLRAGQISLRSAILDR